MISTLPNKEQNDSILKKLINKKFTYTTYFLINATDFEYGRFKDIFIDSYLGINNLKCIKFYSSHVCVLLKETTVFKNLRIENKIDIIKEILKIDELLFIHDSDNKSTIYLCFYPILENFKNQFDLFLEGKYSKFSNEFKQRCLGNQTNSGKTLKNSILYPTSEDKKNLLKELDLDFIHDDLEIASKPDLNKEFPTIEELINKHFE